MVRGVMDETLSNKNGDDNMIISREEWRSY